MALLTVEIFLTLSLSKRGGGEEEEAKTKTEDNRNGGGRGLKRNIHFTDLTSEHKAELQRGQKAVMKGHQSLFMSMTVSPRVSSSVCL